MTAAIVFIWLYAAEDFSEVINLTFPGFLVFGMRYDGAIRGKWAFCHINELVLFLDMEITDRYDVVHIIV